MATEELGTMEVANMLKRSLMAWSWAYPNRPNGPAGTGLARELARAWAATAAISADEFLGIGKEAGNIVPFAQGVLLEWQGCTLCRIGITR